MADERRPTFAAGVRLQTDTATGQGVLLYPEGILQLNETAHEIALGCDGLTTVTQLITTLAAKYEISESELESDIGICLGDWQRQRLIVFT